MARRRLATSGLVAAAMAAVFSAAAGYPATANAADSDAARGKSVYGKCQACHVLDKPQHRVGPALAGVIGRTAGTATDAAGKTFRYSPAMTAAGEQGLVWTEDTLDAYLADPKGFVPKNRMPFPGLKDAADRADVITYIKSRMGGG